MIITLRNQPILVKALFLLTAYVAHGRPFEGIADYGYALLVVSLLLFGSVRDQIKPVLVILGLAVLGLGHFVPHLAIPEQQRLLMDNQQRFILPDYFLKDSSKYPCFLTADGYVQGYKDKRLVPTIDIEGGILSLRSGWINRPEYNFYSPVSPHVRYNLPFVVGYEIVPQMVGMTLNLEGLMVFERNGLFTVHDYTVKTLQLQGTHVGSVLWGFGGQWDATGYNNLTIQLQKTTLYKFYGGVRLGSFLLGLGMLFLGLFFVQWTVDHVLQALLLCLPALFFWVYSPSVLRWGIIARGGKDGIIHGGFPYWMLEKWAAGDWKTAFMSPESVFYFMPGMRYVRFVEMFLFGDAYILQVCLLICVPVIFYRFFSVFLSRTCAVSLCLLMLACFLNDIGLSVVLYVNSLLNLYGEGFAYALLFIAITMLAKSIHKVGWGVMAFFLLAISISIRPNLAVFVGVISGVHLFTTTFSVLPQLSRFMMLFGLAPVFLIPVHNILGGEFVLLTKASAIKENLSLPPRLYLEGLYYLMGMNEAFNEGGKFIAHFHAFYPQYVLAWVGSLWLSLKGQTPVMRSLALATFAGLSMHFFYLLDLRYLQPYLTIILVLGLSQVPRLRKIEQSFSS